MKRKKGFIFIETLVVVAILTVSLLMTYSTYNSAVIKENIRIRYNDSAYMYRTYYLSQFFRNFRLDMVASNLNQDAKNGSINILSGFDCNNSSIFVNETDNQGTCEQLFNSLHINNLYLTYNDLGFLQDCSDITGKCEVLVQVREEAANYLKTIGGNGKQGYRILVEYAEKKDGTSCSSTDEDCMYYYTTLSLGEI